LGARLLLRSPRQLNRIEVTMMKALWGVLISVAAFVALPARAEDSAMTAADLQQLCRGSDTTSRNVCRIYILGVTQGIEAGLNMHTRRPCVPAMSAEALQQAIKSKLDEQLSTVPADGKLAAAGVIGGILAHTYPCQ
jgi:hypothetical protein